MPTASFQGPNKDFALHTIGWQAFQDLAVSVAESEYVRSVSRVAKSSDEGRDGFFYGVPDEAITLGDQRETTLQSKHFSNPMQKLTVASLKSELVSVKNLVATNRADGYILMTNANVSEADRKKIVAALKACGVLQPYVHGRDWIVAKILEHPRVRAMVPRIYGLGDLSWIADKDAREQAEAIIDSMGDDLACYVPTKAHREAVLALDEHRFVLLLGDPAVGKSTIAAALSVAATDEDKSEVIYVRNPEEFVSTWKPDIPNRLFWIDDGFGSIQYTPELMDRWNKVFQSMKAAIKRKNRFILTSRSYIWRQAQTDLKTAAFPPLTEGRVVVDVEKLTVPEKERILYNHLKFGKQSRSFQKWLLPHLDQIVASPHFRPEIARRLGNPAFTDVHIPDWDWLDRFFRYPERFLQDTLSKLATPLKAAIGLIFVNSGRLSSPIIENEASNLITGSYGVSLAEIKAALETMKGSFVNIIHDDEQTYWTYKHPTIADAFARIVGEYEELISVYIRGTKITQILREANVGGTGVKGTNVAIGASQYALLIERFTASSNLSITDVRRFLIERCGPKFFKLFLVAFAEKFPWDGSLSRPLNADDRARLFLKAQKLGVLPLEHRAKFILQIAEQIIDEGDIDFLDDDEEFENFLTADEKNMFLQLAKSDLIRSLDSIIEAEASSWQDGWDPDDWFDNVRQSINTLQKLFPDDDSVREKVLEAHDKIDDQVRHLRDCISDDDDEVRDAHESGNAMVSSSTRSIFEDLIN
jgi:energy-coupling factor transporter ATP-binding protein EcfA2